jgi:hypothetical protein
MTAFIGFGMALAIVVVAIVMIAMAVIGRRRSAPRPDPAYADDPTGYVPGVWLLSGADSTGEHAHRDGDVRGGGDAGDGDGGAAQYSRDP